MNAIGPSAGSPTGPPAIVNPRAIVDRHAPHRRGLHHEIVRMLAIDDRLAVIHLAGLKQLAIALRPAVERIEAEHPDQRQLALARRLRVAIPIHQLVETNSSPPLGPP